MCFSMFPTVGPGISSGHHQGSFKGDRLMGKLFTQRGICCPGCISIFNKTKTTMKSKTQFFLISFPVFKFMNTSCQRKYFLGFVPFVSIHPSNR